MQGSSALIRNGYSPEGVDKNACLEEEEQEQRYSQKSEQTPACDLPGRSFQSPVAEGHAQDDPSSICAFFGQPAKNLASDGTEDVSKSPPLAFRAYGRQAVKTLALGSGVGVVFAGDYFTPHNGNQ